VTANSSKKIDGAWDCFFFDIVTPQSRARRRRQDRASRKGLK
jgi:hypothetical protein